MLSLICPGRKTCWVGARKGFARLLYKNAVAGANRQPRFRVRLYSGWIQG